MFFIVQPLIVQVDGNWLTGRNCLVLALWGQHPTLAECSPLRNDPLSVSPFIARGWPLSRHFDIFCVTVHPWLYSAINLIEICLFGISSRKTNYFELTFSFFSFCFDCWVGSKDCMCLLKENTETTAKNEVPFTKDTRENFDSSLNRFKKKNKESIVSLLDVEIKLTSFAFIPSSQILI